MRHHHASVFSRVNGQWDDLKDRLAARQEARSLMFEIVMGKQEAVGQLPPGDEPGHARDESLDAVNRIVAVFPTVSFPKNGHVDLQQILVGCADDSPGSL